MICFILFLISGNLTYICLTRDVELLSIFISLTVDFSLGAKDLLFIFDVACGAILARDRWIEQTLKVLQKIEQVKTWLEV